MFANLKSSVFVASIAVLIVGAVSLMTNSRANGKPQDAPKSNAATKASATLVADFEKYLSGSVLTGVFTLDGQPLDKLNEERYEIKTAKKIDGDDNLWEIVTRIKYGDKDLEVPVSITVEWVGKTPVMVMDSVSIPGMGTFSARVVFHDRKYAGTWKHDNVGGHLFGRVEPKAK